LFASVDSLDVAIEVEDVFGFSELSFERVCPVADVDVSDLDELSDEVEVEAEEASAV
jgi:predicted membrane chloride channel (bestrophin family)